MRDLRLFPERLTRSTQDRLRSIIDRGKQVLERPRADATNIVEFSRLDLLPLESQRAKWPRYDQLVNQGSAKVPQFADLLTDLFFGLYFAEPKLKARSRMAKTHHLNYDLFMQTQALPMWEEARTTAVYNPKHAIIGLVYVAQALLDAINEPQQQHQRDQHEKQQEQSDLQQQLNDLIKELADAMPPPPDGDPQDDADGDQDGSGTPQPGDTESGQEAGSGIAGMFGSLFGDDETETPDDGADGPEATADADPDPDPDPAQESLADDIEAQIEKLLAQIGNDGDGADDGPELDEARVRRAAKSGMKQANQHLDELNDWLSAWGSDPGEFNALAPDVAFSLYERMRDIPNVKQFAMELGRMRASGLDAQLQKDSREPREIVDITTGRSWSDALPTERIMLAVPELEDVFWLKWAQEGLLTWQYGGVEKASRGPFIMLIDVSGSTMGGPERWGKAFALTALDMARRDDRDCGIIFFDSHIRSEGIFTFPGGKASLTDKIDVASYWTGGGTNWQPPLAQALTNIEATDGTWKEADIVLITDGACEVDQEFAADYRRRCETRGIRTHGVLLDDYGYGNASTLEAVCDRAIVVSSLAGSDAARPIFDLLA